MESIRTAGDCTPHNARNHLQYQRSIASAQYGPPALSQIQQSSFASQLEPRLMNKPEQEVRLSSKAAFEAVALLLDSGPDAHLLTANAWPSPRRIRARQLASCRRQWAGG